MIQDINRNNTDSEKVRLRDVFNFRDKDARTRVFLLISVSIQSALTYFISGIFYTGFLAGYDMDIVDVSILAFAPSIAGLFVVFTPGILTKFPRRRWILGGCKFMYYLLVFVGITLVPTLLQDGGARRTAIIVISIVAAVFNVLSVAGYSAWHIRFIPEKIRSLYLGVTQFAGAFIAGVTVLISGWVSDSLAAMAERQLRFITLVRYAAFGLALVDVLMLLLPREVDYPLLHPPKMSDIFSIPLHNKKFMMTMVLVFMNMFAEGITASSMVYYLLNDIHITYTFYNLIIIVYSPFFLLCLGFWRKVIARTSWFTTYAITMAFVGPLQILYGFVQPGFYIPLMLIVRIPQHFFGVGQNVSYGNFPFVNMPDNNRTCYTSFYQICSTLGYLSSMIFATVFHALLDDRLAFTAFGYTYRGGMPWLIFMSGAIQILMVLYILLFRKKMEPDPVVPEPGTQPEAQ